MSEVRIADVTASHNGQPVLRGIDLHVPEGSTTVILGPSGCGKTTLLRVIAGFQAPDSGSVALGDDVVVGPGLWRAPERRGVGYVAQEGNLFPHLSVGANVVYGLDRAARRDTARLGELLRLVGLDVSLADRRPDQLSGGQQQRVALARALARRPEVLLLDEPFSSLDAALRTSTREAVAEVLRREGVTAILVTHDQSEALSMADQVAIMHDGRFSQVGSPADVYDRPADTRSAGFLGDAVTLAGRAAAGTVHHALGVVSVEHVPDGPVDVLLRPEQIALVAQGSGRPATVLSSTYFGHDALIDLDLGAAARDVDSAGVHAVVRARVRGQDVPPDGTVVSLQLLGEPLVFPQAGGAAAG
ncbi:MAG: ABC transporter ATP-binding protein [Terrabacter sp.]